MDCDTAVHGMKREASGVYARTMTAVPLLTIKVLTVLNHIQYIHFHPTSLDLSSHTEHIGLSLVCIARPHILSLPSSIVSSTPLPRRPYSSNTNNLHQATKMSHESVWYSHPRTYGKGARSWSVHLRPQSFSITSHSSVLSS